MLLTGPTDWPTVGAGVTSNGSVVSAKTGGRGPLGVINPTGIAEPPPKLTLPFLHLSQESAAVFHLLNTLE